METILISTFVVALAEIGDRTQLLAIVLATRFHKPWPIIAGIPPILDAFVHVGPLSALGVVVFFTAVVTIEGYLIVPLVIVSLMRALKSNFPAHKRIARWTLPLWAYVSVTGVIVYWLLYIAYTPLGAPA